MSKINLGQYLDVLKAGDNDVLQAQAITGKSREEILKLSVPELVTIINQYGAELKQNTGKRLYKDLKLIRPDGSTLRVGFHPNLEYMSFSEYIDINSFLETFPQSLPSIMSILYRPITAELNDRYLIEDYDALKHTANANLFRQVPVEAVNGVMVFFYLLRSDLMNTTLDYLSNQTTQVITDVETLTTETLQTETRRPTP
jgi:hypothetical protein